MPKGSFVMEDLAHFLALIIWNFWTVAAGIMLAFEPVMRWFVKEYDQIAARYIPPDSRRKVARFAALAAFVFANYLAFHDLSAENRALKVDRDARGNSQSPYKWPMLTPEETVALRAKIREINPRSVAVSCAEDDCGDLARNFRDIFGGLHWQVMCCGSPFTGFDPGIHLWGETSELKGVAHDIEQATNGRLKVDMAEHFTWDVQKFPLQITIGSRP
jgi:hypothetical protein